MPGNIKAIGPDACSDDRCASCRYWHTKQRAMAGEVLSDDEWALIGVDNRSPSPDGWRSPSLPSAVEADPVLVELMGIPP